MCDVRRQAVQMCAVHRATATKGIPAAPGQELGTCVSQTCMLNIFQHIRHISTSWHFLFSPFSSPFSLSFLFLSFVSPSPSRAPPLHSKSFKHPQSSGLLGSSAIVRWRVVTSPCQSEGEQLVEYVRIGKQVPLQFRYRYRKVFWLPSCWKGVAMDRRTFSSALGLASRNSL